MTRPNIVRADTLDLQDEDHPTAAEHQKPNLQGGLAPHQRAEVHHVLEERVSEEHALEDAWNIADNLTDEPDAIDQAQHQQQQNGGQQEQPNGAQQTGGEGGEDEDADDDMMDRISSSPSIEDGGYTMHSSPPSTLPRRRTIWPVRSSSLTPSPRNTPTPTRETFNQSSSSPTDSSPFLQTPQHFPLQARRAEREASRLASHIELSSSPFDQSPRHLPTITVEQVEDKFSLSSKHHHSRGRYMDSRELEPLLETEESDIDSQLLAPLMETEDDDMDLDATKHSSPPQRVRGSTELQDHRRGSDQTSQNSAIIHDIDPDTRPIESPFRTHNFARSMIALPEPYLEQSPSLNSIASVDLKDVLLPVDDPLLDTPPSPTDDADSWESLSSDSDSLDESTNDDDTDALFADLEPRFIDSGWGGECLRETEDIDFEFVYALHTFVATVEGQANATKGDTMVLLDDSNSYWWLVRVVKDASIGYLPAEHIETPTERLARLNKHRNIDLSATMLSDNSEKSRNPLKKAMRRRNAKTVQFAAPTYVEASDYEYDTEDEEQPEAEEQTTAVQAEETQQQNGEQHEAEQAAEKRNSYEEGAVRTSSSSSRLSFDREQAATLAANADEPQLSPKLVDKTEAAPLKSKRTRNTDSFLKDDSIETRKITLTPGLLREESAGKSSTSTDSLRNASLENIVSSIQQPAPLSKKDSKKEKKEKKGGMLSGLFKSKKKEKKPVESGDSSDIEKPSNEFQRESPSRSPLTSGRASPVQDVSSLLSPIDTRRPEVQTRQPTRGKLTKTPPSGSSPVREAQVQEQSAEFVAELQGSEAAVEMGSAEPEPAATQEPEPVQKDLPVVEEKEQNEGPLSPLTNLLKRDDSKTQKPAKAKKAKARMELDDFDSPSEEDGPNPFKEQEARAATAEGDDEEEEGERLSESPIEITHNTFMHGTEIIHIPTPSPDDANVDNDEDEEEPESLTSSPSLIDHPAEPPSPAGDKPPNDEDLTPTAPRSPNPTTSTSKSVDTPTREFSIDSLPSTTLTPSTSASQQSWSDSSLRAWLEDGSEVRDLMVLVHDTSGVEPVGEDHPILAGLFTEERKGVSEMMGRLDGLLGEFLGGRGIVLS